MNLEDDLRAALRREPAPPDFAAKVMRRTRVVSIWHRPVTLAIAAAIAAVAILPPAYEYRQHQRALEAKDQLIAALSITQTQLQHTKQKLLQNTRHRQ